VVDEDITTFSNLLRHHQEVPIYSSGDTIGESIATSCLRVDRIISIWQNSCAGQKIIAVCHGNIMMAFRVRLERYKIEYN
jgi:broad specificity phosphatase PhoE